MSKPNPGLLERAHLIPYLQNDIEAGSEITQLHPVFVVHNGHMKLTTIPTTGLAEFVAELARQHGVTYAKTPYDSLAEAITNLSDDSVEMDDVELLLIALERAGVLPSEDVMPLHINYLREKLKVRPL